MINRFSIYKRKDNSKAISIIRNSVDIFKMPINYVSLGRKCMDKGSKQCTDCLDMLRSKCSVEVYRQVQE